MDFNFIPIFDCEGEDPSKCVVWSIEDSETGKCDFWESIDYWRDPGKIFEFISEHEHFLKTDFWKRNGITTVLQAVRKILIEAESFAQELEEAFEKGLYEDYGAMMTIFKNLHDNVYYVGKKSKEDIVKAKPKNQPAMLRFYGVRLPEEPQVVLTGGGIKFTRPYQDTPGLSELVAYCEKISEYISDNQIQFLP